MKKAFDRMCKVSGKHVSAMVQGMDLNPIMIRGDEPVVADALVVLG